ncbi:hypothetical protein MXB_5198 [Myxobolus squamalis]|nr:hypothetical protein MXB_5198 [Myxobolus squamalis]
MKNNESNISGTTQDKLPKTNETQKNAYQGNPYPYPYPYNPYGYYYAYNVTQPFYYPPNAYYPTIQPSACYPWPQNIHQPASTSFQPPCANLPPTKWWTTNNTTSRPLTKRPPSPSNHSGITLSIKKTIIERENIPDVFKCDQDRTIDVVSSEKVIESQENSQLPSKKEIPQSLKDYVRLSFLACKTDLQKDQMEIQIRNLLKKAVSEGTAFSTNWLTIPPLKYISLLSSQTFSTKASIFIQKKQIRAARAQCYDIGVDLNKKIERQARFDSALISFSRPELLISAQTIGTNKPSNVIEGTSKALEKYYLRLTNEPDPSLVRPLSALVKSFDHVMKIWTENRNYSYASEQFKSIRQDLTIQGIRNEFSVGVYEENARIALLMSDREEFNQCQTCLKELYREGFRGHETEFLVYNILYHIYTSNHIEMANLLPTLTLEQQSEPCVRLTLKLYFAFCDTNYEKFFKIYRKIEMPYAKALINLFIDSVRITSLKVLMIAYLPTMKQECVSSSLGFENLAQFHMWLTDIKLNFIAQGDFDCKHIRAQLNDLCI